jgi:hypothetical protein
LLLLLAYALLIFSPLIADPDLWGHVRFGLDTLQTGQIVRSDPYSYLTAGQPWVNHEWLSEAIQALAYRSAGAGGIIALNVGLALLTVALLYGRLVARGMGEWAAALVVAGFAWMLRPGVLNARPQVWTYLMLALVALAIEGIEWRRANAGGHVSLGWMLAIGAIVAAWANLHGGVLAGVGVVGLWAAGRLAEAAAKRRSWRREWGVVAALMLAAGALLLNPYGAGLITFLLRTATVARPEIADWQPATPADPWGQVWAAGVLLTVAALALSRRPWRLPLLLPLAALALLPLLSIRHIPLFAVAAPALAAEHFAGAWQRLRDRIALPARDLSGFLNLTGLVAAAALVALAAPRLGGIVVDPTVSDVPARAVAVLKAAGVEGNLAVEFNWGEYAIWHLGPGVQVSVDGRRETVYSDQVYRENLDFMLGEGEWDRLVARPETEMALVDRARPADRLMRGKVGWVVAYEDEAATLFVREGSPWLERIARVEPPDWPANGAGLAFPVE